MMAEAPIEHSDQGLDCMPFSPYISNSCSGVQLFGMYVPLETIFFMVSAIIDARDFFLCLFYNGLILIVNTNS